MNRNNSKVSATSVLLAASIILSAPLCALSAEQTVASDKTPASSSQNTSQTVAGSSNVPAAATPAATIATPSNANASSTTPATEAATTSSSKLKWHPGMELDATTQAQDLVPTDDVELAKKQVEAFPDSPEASFILAVALTRTSKVEDALKEVRRARKLAEQKGGAEYFNKMISTYEELLKNFPNENRVRYGLAWAYYMKAYLLADHSRKVAAWIAKHGDPAAVLAASGNDPAKVIEKAKAELAAEKSGQTLATTSGASVKTVDGKTIDAARSALQSAVQPGKPLDVNNILAAAGSLAQGNTSALPKIPSVMDNVDPKDIPQIRKYYELALNKLDDLLAQKPDDVWARVYRAHLKAEYTGNIDEAMQTWTQCREKFPNNPASYFFLGEGFLKQGNLKESLNNVSKAVALRAMGY